MVSKPNLLESSDAYSLIIQNVQHYYASRCVFGKVRGVSMWAERIDDYAWAGWAVATVSPVAAWLTSMKPDCFGLDIALRLER